MLKDHSAALALVSIHTLSENSEKSGAKASASSPTQDDPDMQRAMDLVELHYGVKMNHVQGEDAGLKEARKDVEAVLTRLKGEKI